MSVGIRVAAAASAELEEAVRWYENQRSGLGSEFHAEVVRTLSLIAEYPESGTSAFGDAALRRVLVKRFPYQVIYRSNERGLLILAFAHLRRRPGFWKGRA